MDSCMRAYSSVQQLLCHRGYCELTLSLARTSCRLLFTARPTARPFAGNPLRDAVRSRNPSKSTLAHDGFATAVLHKHHQIICVGAGLIQFVYRSHLCQATEVTRNRNAFSPFSRELDLRLSVVCVHIFWFSFSKGKICPRKKQLVQDLILSLSINIHMCTLYTYTNMYMPRFSPSGFFGSSRCRIPTTGLTSEHPIRALCVCVFLYTHLHPHTLPPALKIEKTQTTPLPLLLSKTTPHAEQQVPS